MVHGILGALVFSLAPVTCFLCYRRFRTDAFWRPLAGWTLVVGVLLVRVVVLRISETPGSAWFDDKGFVQRVFLVASMAWLFAVASRLGRWRWEPDEEAPRLVGPRR